METPHTPQPDVDSASDWSSPVHVRALVLLAITAIALYYCARMIAPFFAPLAWALALAVLFAPLHRRIADRLARPTASALLCVFIVAVIVLVPAVFIGGRIGAEAARGIDVAKGLVESGGWRQAFDVHPAIAPVGRWLESQFDLPAVTQAGAAWLTETATAIARGSILQLAGIALTFYLLFYFLRDRGVVLNALARMSPLSKPEMQRIFSRVFDTVHATVYGTLAMAALQGVLGGLMFWWLGLPAPLLWGSVMAVLAVIPVLGPFVVWIPAALFLLLDGDGFKALVLTVWGTVVVGGIDNLLYPILVGERLKMHTVVTLVAIVGGLVVFGAAGLIIGPVLFTVTRSLLEIWTRRNADGEASPCL